MHWSGHLIRCWRVREHGRTQCSLACAVFVSLTALLAWGMKIILSCVQSAHYTIYLVWLDDNLAVWQGLREAQPKASLGMLV